MSKLAAFERRYIPEPNSGCWIWLGMYQVGRDYGLFCYKRKTVRAHRAAWELFCGPIPHGHGVLHKCDNPSCVNPDHLMTGTQKDNMSDASKKNRMARMYGEHSNNSKLNENMVRAIRLEAASGATTRKLVQRFGIVKSTVRRIINGQTWPHVK